MARKNPCLIGLMLLGVILAACSGGEPNEAAVQTAIARTQQAESGIVPTSESPAQTDPITEPLPTQGEIAQAEVSYIPYHMTSKNNGDGWVNYSILIAIQYQGNTPVTIYDDRTDGGGYHEIDEDGFKGYVIPPFTDFVTTTDGNTYPVFLTNYCGDLNVDSDQKIQMAMTFSGLETTRLFPDTTLVRDNQPFGILTSYGACFKVPETLTPSQITLMTSETTSQTIDFNQVPPELSVNFEPVGINAVPAVLKMGDFEISVSDFQLSGSENGESIYQAKVSVTNTILNGDRFFKLGTYYAISNDGLLFKPGNFATTRPDSDLTQFSNKKVGPGQTYEGTINLSIPQSQTIPSQLYFYMVMRDNQWFSFKAVLPAP